MSAEGNLEGQRRPRVAFGGGSYLVVWEYGLFQDEVRGVRVGPGGGVLDAAPGTILADDPNSDQSDPNIAFDGTNFVLAWSDGRARPDSRNDIYTTRVSPSATSSSLAGTLLSTAANQQTDSAVAFDGQNYLVVWTDRRPGAGTDIYGVRVSATGSVLDPDGIAISQGANEQRFPRVATNGSSFMVVWEDTRNGEPDIYAARVSAQGTVLDPMGIPIATGTPREASPGVAVLGSNYLVVWDSGYPAEDVYAARVSGAGVLLDPAGILLSTGPGYQSDPAVASSGASAMVVWVDRRTSNEGDIYGRRVALDGSLLSGEFIVTDAAGPQVRPAIASSGSGYLVAWDTRFDVRASRITADGVVLDTGLAVSVEVGNQMSPAVAWDGTQYWVAWQDPRNNTPLPLHDIYASRVSTAGTVLDPSGILVQGGLEDELAPALSAGGGRSGLFVYHRHDAEEPHGIARVFGRLFEAVDAGTGGSGGAGVGGAAGAGVGGSAMGGSGMGGSANGGAASGGSAGTGGGGGGGAGVGGSFGGAGGTAGNSSGGSAGLSTGGTGAVGGGNGGSSSGRCVPGQAIACPCPGGVQGVQTCEDDGQSYGPCAQCPAIDAGADAAGGSGPSGGSDDGGCGCRTAPSQQSKLAWVLLPGLLLFGRRRRRASRYAA